MTSKIVENGEKRLKNRRFIVYFQQKTTRLHGKCHEFTIIVKDFLDIPRTAHYNESTNHPLFRVVSRGRQSGGLALPNRSETASLSGRREKFSRMTQEEIVCLAQAGDGDACARIFETYKRFVQLKSRAYFLSGGDHEDVLQEGMIGLFKAVRDYRPERESSFRSFAELCVTRNILTAVKMATRQKHSPLNGYVSTSQFETLQQASFDRAADLNPERLVIEREDFLLAETEIAQSLSRFEAQILAYHIQGYSYNAVARMMGKTPKSIDNGLQRIKRKLERFLRKPRKES
jgi:RNA polymerase sporulation-specific sigma factor